MPVFDIAGKQYRYPEGFTRGGAVDDLVQDGTLTPEQGALAVGEEPTQPETGGLSPFLPAEQGSTSAAQAIGLGRRMAQLGVGEDVGTAGQQQLQENQPVAAGFGTSLPMFAAGPSIAGAAIVGGGLEAIAQRERFRDDPVGAAISTGLESARQGAATAGGRVLGELGGRVVNAIRLAGRNAFVSMTKGVNDLTLPSGIRTTLGKLTGNRQIQQTEASLARNPVTSRKFAQADLNNERVMRDATLKWLDQAPGGSLEKGMTTAVQDSVELMDKGIPDEVVVTIPRGLDKIFKRLNKVTSEAFDLPATADIARGAEIPRGIGGSRGSFTIAGQKAKQAPPIEVSGADLRAIVSDLRSGIRSSTASVRRTSRQALNELDQVLLTTPGVDQSSWRAGSRLYGKWERLSRPGVISRADPEKINPTSLFRVVEKGNKVAARTRGNVSSGDVLTDNLLQTARDFERVGSLTPDSGTPTGLAVPLILGDVAATGGVGTGAAFLAAEASQGPIGLGIAEAATTGAPASARAGAQTARGALGALFPPDAIGEEDEN